MVGNNGAVKARGGSVLKMKSAGNYYGWGLVYEADGSVIWENVVYRPYLVAKNLYDGSFKSIPVRDLSNFKIVSYIQGVQERPVAIKFSFRGVWGHCFSMSEIALWHILDLLEKESASDLRWHVQVLNELPLIREFVVSNTKCLFSFDFLPVEHSIVQL